MREQQWLRRVFRIYSGQDNDNIAGDGWPDERIAYSGVSPIEVYRYNSTSGAYDHLHSRSFYEGAINNPALVEVDGNSDGDLDDLADHAYIPLLDDRGTVMGVATGKAGTYNGISRNAGDLIEKIYYNSTGLVRAYYANGTFNSQHPNRSSYIDYGWCGMPRSRFTGLYHTHYRDYDAIHGRWLNEDPAGYADGLNLYNNYAGVNGVDPTGLYLSAIMETITRPVVDVTQGIGVGLIWTYDNALKPAASGIGVAVGWTHENLDDGVKHGTAPVRHVAYWGAFRWIGGDYLEPYKVAVSDDFHGGDPGSNKVVFVINGILNNEDDVRKFLENRIEKVKYREGLAIFNPSTMDDSAQDWLNRGGKVGRAANKLIAGARDVIQTIGQKAYLPDSTAKLAAEEIEKFSKNNPDVEICLEVHSQGGAIASNLGMYLDDDVQAKVRLYTYGSAANPTFGWGKQVHVTNILDPVPHVTGLLFRAALGVLDPNIEHVFRKGPDGKLGLHTREENYSDCTSK